MKENATSTFYPKLSRQQHGRWIPIYFQLRHMQRRLQNKLHRKQNLQEKRIMERSWTSRFNRGTTRRTRSGYSTQQGANAMSDRFQGMTPEWHKEHEQAFELAQNEAKGHFNRCPRCHKYVCENDWNEQEGLCI